MPREKQLLIKVALGKETAEKNVMRIEEGGVLAACLPGCLELFNFGQATYKYDSAVVPSRASPCAIWHGSWPATRKS